MNMPIETPELDPLSREQQLCAYVVERANRGDDVATILAGALTVFSEEPPADDDPPVFGGYTDLEAAAMLIALTRLKRRRGWAQLGLA